MALEKEQIKAIMPNVTKLDDYYPFLIEAMKEFEINNYLRISAFLAQTAHESAEFKYMRELWGTEQQKKYDPPHRLAKELGNTEVGDGKRYRGRGIIQLTGKANYAKFGPLLGIDAVENPELLETPEYAFRVAGAFWNDKDLNLLADCEAFKNITVKINGGLNGYKERCRYYELAKKVLPKDITLD